MHWRRKWQPTPVFLPGESQGSGSLVGCRLWGRRESDKTEATAAAAAAFNPNKVTNLFYCDLFLNIKYFAPYDLNSIIYSHKLLSTFQGKKLMPLDAGSVFTSVCFTKYQLYPLLSIARTEILLKIS